MARRNRMTTYKTVLTAAIAAAVIGIPALAWADPTARLMYVRNAGAEDCPDEEALRAATTARLGYEPFRPIADVTVIARMTRTRGMYRGDIELIDGRGVQIGVRKLEEASAHCEDVVAAMALTVSILIDPLSLTRPPPAAPPSPSPPATPVEAAPAPSSPPSEPPPARVEVPARNPEPLRRVLFAGLGGMGAFGLAPSASLSATLFGGVRLAARFSVALEVRVDAPAGADAAAGPGRVASHTLVGSLVPCLHLGPVLGCAVASVGALFASSNGIAEPASDRAPYVSVGPRIGADLPIAPRISLRPTLELGVPLTERALAINGKVADQLAAVWAGGGASVVATF